MANKILWLLLGLELCLVFSLGFISGIISNKETLREFPLSSNNYEEASPSDYIQEDNIKLYKDRVVILIDNPSISSYADTNSMLPVLDAGSNGIKFVPKSEKEIKVGDIISFKSENKIIVHRVVNIGSDELGTYFITKGDNNKYADEKIRFSDIVSKTIAIIY